MRRGLISILAVVCFAAAGVLTSSAIADNGNSAANAPLPNAALDASVQGYGGVQVITIRPSSQVQGVAGAQHTSKKTPTCAELAAQGGTQGALYKRMCSHAAPLSATHTSGTLPFTGLQLTIAVALGVALLGGGFLLRRAAREGGGS
jgi:hypothetical protein